MAFFNFFFNVYLPIVLKHELVDEVFTRVSLYTFSVVIDKVVLHFSSSSWCAVSYTSSTLGMYNTFFFNDYRFFLEFNTARTFLNNWYFSSDLFTLYFMTGIFTAINHFKYVLMIRVVWGALSIFKTSNCITTAEMVFRLVSNHSMNLNRLNYLLVFLKLC